MQLDFVISLQLLSVPINDGGLLFLINSFSYYWKEIHHFSRDARMSHVHL